MKKEKTNNTNKPNNSTDWESRLEMFFKEINYDDGSFYWEKGKNLIKDFISSEFQRERDRTLEEVKEIINVYEPTNWEEMDIGYEEACSNETRNELRHELLSKINKLK